MAYALPFDADQRVCTVTELTRRLQGMLQQLGRVSVRGEVSRVSVAASGHVYFDLKDLDSKIACTIWRSQASSALRFELAEGAAVVVHGKLDVYGPRGSYSLIVQRVEQEGLGAMLVQLEALKQELRERGWLDRRRALPPMPRAIGVVTSRDGAALQDFLRTRSLRWPLYPLVLCHTCVQGKNASVEIAAAIERVAREGVDVIALIRGGGSLEDLWSFNELPVAQAIWNSPVPVVTGVGHEVDVTLADLVADHRAHTPTDAAQTLIPDRAALLERLDRAGNWLSQAIDHALDDRERRLRAAARSRALAAPQELLIGREQGLAHLAARLRGGLGSAIESRATTLATLHRRLDARHPRWQLERRLQRVANAATRLGPALARLVDARERRFERASAKLEALSPVAILARGYSLTTREGESRPVTDASSLVAGERLSTRLASGRVVSRVERVESAPAGGDERR